MMYKIEIEMQGDTDMSVEVVTKKGKTTYSPVVFQIVEINGEQCFYTESKDGSIRHLYSVHSKRLLDPKKAEAIIEAIFQLKDKQRF